MLYPNPQIYHHLKVIFVHVPKTAGTSIENRLRAHPRDVVGGHTTALAYRKAFPKQFDSYYKFAFVRHPLERFLSAYRYLRERPVHEALRNDIIHETKTLGRFVEVIRHTPSILAQIVHFMPAHYFVTDSCGTMLVDAIYKYEQLPDAWREICHKIGTPHRGLAHSNASPRLSAMDISSVGLAPAIRNLYARDYELFGYQLRHDIPPVPAN